LPEVFRKNGWRFFFYSNEGNEPIHEGNEPIHIHCKNSEKICKYFIDKENKKIFLAFEKNLNKSDFNEVEKLINENIDLIIKKWNEFFK